MALSLKTIVFLHGWGTSSAVWKQQVEYFSKKYNVETPPVIASDCERSEAGAKQSPEGDCFVAPSELLAMTSVAQSRASAILIGWSYGGMRAIELALRNPGKFNALVLVGCSARFSEGISTVVIKNIIRNLKREFEGTMRNCYGTFFSDTEAGFRDKFITETALPDQKETIDILNRLMDLDLKEKLGLIDMPVCVVHGDKDGVCPVSGGEFLHKNIRGSKFMVLKKAGHMPFYTRPDEFNQALEGFIINAI